MEELPCHEPQLAAAKLPRNWRVLALAYALAIHDRVWESHIHMALAVAGQHLLLLQLSAVLTLLIAVLLELVNMALYVRVVDFLSFRHRLRREQGHQQVVQKFALPVTVWAGLQTGIGAPFMHIVILQRLPIPLRGQGPRE